MNTLKLNKICTNITDGKHGNCTQSNKSDCYFISAKDIVDNKIDYTKARKITQTDYIESNKRTRLEINDILVTNSGTIGKMAIIKEIPHPTTFQKSVAILKPNSDLIKPRYLFYYLLANKEYIINLAQGSTQLNLLLKDIRSIEVTIPTEAKQQHIVNTIGSIDDLIENKRQIIEKLSTESNYIYSEYCFNKSSMVSLGEYCDIKTGKLNAEQSDANGKYPFFTCGKDELLIDDYAFDCNAIIIAGNGEISVKYYSGKFNAYQRTYVLEPNKYFYLFLKQCELSINDLKNNSQGSVIKFITKGMLENIQIPLNEHSELINNKLMNIYKQISNYNKQIKKLENNKKILLEKYFTSQ